MKVRFYTYEYPNKFKMVELNKEGVAYVQEVADKYSEEYSNYVVSVDYDEHGIHFYLDGPWEC